MALWQKNKKFNWFILGILIINILQSILTPIIRDEAYYWRFAQDLDWGYFDHPPMVAFIIKLSSFFFSGELGIRFITVLLFALMVKIIWELIPEENKEHKNSVLIFFVILFSIPVFNIYGFITTPDTPLLFFIALYLLAIKKIEIKSNLINALFLGLSAALLIFSKYHGFIVILLSILFKPTLLKKKTTYIAGIFSLILILPHLYWQYKNDFITFNYHLFQRANIGFEVKHVFDYLFGMAGILNPAFVLLLFIQFIKKKSILKENYIYMARMFVGYILFFFIYSFRAGVEAHWVAFAMIPMTVMLYNLCISNQKIYSIVKYIGIISIILLFSIRILIMIDLPIKSEFHTKRKDYSETIAKLANERSVVFVNSYQKASKYTFYTGQKSFSVNTIKYHKNQYDLWDIGNYLYNKKVLIIGDRTSSFLDTLKLERGDYLTYKKVGRLPLFGKLEAVIKTPLTLFNCQKSKLRLMINNPYKYDFDLQKENLHYQISFLLERKSIESIIPLTIEYPQKINKNFSNGIDVSYLLNNIQEGQYKLSVIMKDRYIYYQQISIKYDIEVKNTIPNVQ